MDRIFTPIRIALSLAALFLALLVLLYFLWRDEVSPDSLGRSVVGQYPGNLYFPCEAEDNGRWRCMVGDGAIVTSYSVRVDGRCWTAERANDRIDDGIILNPKPGPQPATLKGCIGIWDQF